MPNVRLPIAHLHTLLSYMWEDANDNREGIVEVNVHELATLMDLINDIAYITDTPLDIADSIA